MAEGRHLEVGLTGPEQAHAKLQEEFDTFKTRVAAEVTVPEKEFDPFAEVDEADKAALDKYLEIVNLVASVLESPSKKVKLDKRMLSSLQSLRTDLSKFVDTSKELYKRGDSLLARAIDYVTTSLAA